MYQLRNTKFPGQIQSLYFLILKKTTGHSTHLCKEPHTPSNKEESVLEHRSYYLFLMDKPV